MPQVWRRIRKFPLRIGLPVGLTTDQYAFLDETEFEDEQPIKNLLEAGGFAAGPAFGSVMLTAGPDNNAFAILATF